MLELVPRAIHGNWIPAFPAGMTGGLSSYKQCTISVGIWGSFERLLLTGLQVLAG